MQIAKVTKQRLERFEGKSDGGEGEVADLKINQNQSSLLTDKHVSSKQPLKLQYFGEKKKSVYLNTLLKQIADQYKIL